ncbi:MAG: murein L,D-transpeptidase catalytic domain family protein [Bacteroidetes bacterium]|nr:murein L,D-transpeptidase catalytic domain family protein [Bacteroidota bacterium]
MSLSQWIGLVCLLSVRSPVLPAAQAGVPDSLTTALYQQIDFRNCDTLNPYVFAEALHGFLNLEAAGKLNEQVHILSVADFSLSSCSKRFWVIDLSRPAVLFNSYVAHGQGSGEDMACIFSNRDGSHASSLGFYVTGDTYEGQHGLSLCLEGMDPGFNNEAMNRNIVIHAAAYVSDTFIAQEGRLGRSWGCPALPPQLADSIIQTIKDSTCLFIFFPDAQYLNKASWLQLEPGHWPGYLLPARSNPGSIPESMSSCFPGFLLASPWLLRQAFQ